jgi:hypothetical protein
LEAYQIYPGTSSLWKKGENEEKTWKKCGETVKRYVSVEFRGDSWKKVEKCEEFVET